MNTTTDDLGPTPHLGYTQVIGRPTIRSVHRSTSRALRAALGTVADYREQIAALRELDRLEVPPPLVASPESVLADELIGSVKTGEQLDLTSEVRDIVTRGQVAATARMAVDLARDRLAAELDEILLRGADQVLHHLAGQLNTIIERTKSLAEDGPLSGLLNAEAAVSSGRVDELAQFRALTEAYADVRGAQDTLLSGIRDPGVESNTQLAEARIFRDVTAVLPTWAPWREFGYLVTREHHYERPITPPWPHSRDRGRALFRNDAATPAFLAWAVSTGVPLWVPDRDQLAAEQDRLEKVLEVRVDDGTSAEVDPAARPAPRNERFANRIMNETRYMAGGVR